MATAKSDRLSLKICVFLFSAVLSLFLVEWLYRLKLISARKRIDYTYRLASNVPIDYDEDFGIRLKPNLESFDCFILHGKVAWGAVVSHSNGDGLGGLTRLEDYENADIKIVIFGDSFAEWNQGSATWPDLLERHLEKVLAKKVAVLNYGRAGYGVLQMLDLAAEKIPELHPDVAVIAPIGDDFSRARWWSKEVAKDGMTRWMLSSRKDNFDDYHFAVDQVLVVPEATREWCERQLVHDDFTEPVLSKANMQFAKISEEVEGVRKAVPLLSWDHSFLYRRLSTGSPYLFPDGNMPRVAMSDLRDDRRAVDDIRRIRMAGTRLILIYVPTMEELKSRTVLASHQDRVLMDSMQALLGTKFRLVQQEYNGGLPAKIDLRPYDWHPNRRGLEFYAAAIARIILPEVSTRSMAAAGLRGDDGRRNDSLGVFQ
jgi:hypothetical protein